jgi:hypothetical protein
MKHRFSISRKVITWINEYYDVDSDKPLEEVIEMAKDFEISPVENEVDYDYMDYLDDYEVRNEKHKLIDSYVSD